MTNAAAPRFLNSSEIKQILYRYAQSLSNIQKTVQRYRCFDIWCFDIADMGPA